MQVVDNVELSNYLKNKGFPLSCLDTNVLPQEFRQKAKKAKEKKGTRRRKTTARKPQNHDLLAIATQIALLGPADQGVVKLEGDESDDEAIDEKKKES